MKRIYKILLIIAIVILGLIIGISIIGKKLEKNMEQLAAVTIPDVDLLKLEDGVYDGNYKAFPIDVEVRVTISNHSITNIELLKHTNGQGSAAEVITDKVVEAQSLQVDIISGATYSSKVILKAIENALENPE